MCIRDRVELLIVVSIIGILAAIVIMGVAGSVDKAKKAATEESMTTAVQSWKAARAYNIPTYMKERSQYGNSADWAVVNGASITHSEDTGAEVWLDSKGDQISSVTGNTNLRNPEGWPVADTSSLTDPAEKNLMSATWPKLPSGFVYMVNFESISDANDAEGKIGIWNTNVTERNEVIVYNLSGPIIIQYWPT
jgi:type II secretory pathway pseudopilin PulG